VIFLNSGTTTKRLLLFEDNRKNAKLQSELDCNQARRKEQCAARSAEQIQEENSPHLYIKHSLSCHRRGLLIIVILYAPHRIAPHIQNTSNVLGPLSNWGTFIGRIVSVRPYHHRHVFRSSLNPRHQTRSLSYRYLPKE